MADICGAYSPFKIVHHPSRIEQLKRGEQIYPVHVQIILTSTCSHDCHFCSYRWSGYSSNQLFTEGAKLSAFGTNNPIREMPYEKVTEILDDCAEMGVKAIQWTGGGEPTVHSRHVDAMRYALDKNLECSLVSHGEIFRDGHIENLLRFKWVRFSIDAGTPETYGSVRRINPKRMDRTVNNIRNLVAARNVSGSDLVIGVGFVVTKENWKEIRIAAELAKHIGVDNIRISAVFQPDDENYFDGFYGEAKALATEAGKLSGDGFSVYDNFTERYQDLVDKSPDHPFCGYQQFTTYIGDDLNVYRCCVLAYNERGKIGSLKDMRFKELWDSEFKKKDFDSFDATKCERCMFNSRLKTILYAIDPNPMHANFV